MLSSSNHDFVLTRVDVMLNSLCAGCDIIFLSTNLCYFVCGLFLVVFVAKVYFKKFVVSIRSTNLVAFDCVEVKEFTAENFEELLAIDDVFLDYFNAFLALPVRWMLSV